MSGKTYEWQASPQQPVNHKTRAVQWGVGGPLTDASPRVLGRATKRLMSGKTHEGQASQQQPANYKRRVVQWTHEEEVDVWEDVPMAGFARRRG
jgi:hypothetical protein